MFIPPQQLEASAVSQEAVLEPEALYGHYQQATHVAACTGGSTGLAARSQEVENAVETSRISARTWVPFRESTPKRVLQWDSLGKLVGIRIQNTVDE